MIPLSVFIYLFESSYLLVAWFSVLQTEVCGPWACATIKAGHGRKENKEACVWFLHTFSINKNFCQLENDLLLYLL